MHHRPALVSERSAAIRAAMAERAEKGHTLVKADGSAVLIEIAQDRPAGARFERLTPDDDWAAGRVASLPTRWQRRILRHWERRRGSAEPEQDARRAANLELLELTDQLGGVRLPLDAGDAEVCARAQDMADQSAQLAQLYHYPEALHAAMARHVERQGLEPPKAKDCGQVMPGIRRMVDPLWWRRGLRKLHAKSVEGAAIRLGVVNKNRDIYVSAESLKRRIQQNERNADTLESTIARNEVGQEFTLAELAAKGTANKAIRRAELMTRIAGFERIARDLGHAGMFLTITCPSRFHKWRTVGAGVIENPRYDGSTPREGQQYLAKVWARIRAKLKRDGLGVYGFRIAEPQHDATPHWHMILFHEPGRLDELRATVTRYALADSPTEPGAHRRRVDFKPIDPNKGSAAGYIAKYVAKNIDGHALRTDLCGDAYIEADGYATAQRVEAWASTWGIRQFQQIGGAPVGPWRELRRVESVPAGAPEHLRAAHDAVNRLAVIEGRDNACVAWDRYTKAQGGVFCGRAYRVRVALREAEGLGRYGEPLGPRPFGVETTSVETYTPDHMRHMGGIAQRTVHWHCESRRYQWEIVSRKKREGAALAPWTRVNNCTAGPAAPAEKTTADRLTAAGIDRWEGGGGQPPEKNEPWQQRN